MKVLVSRRATLVALVALAGAVIAYLAVPPVHRAVNEVVRILTVPDTREAIFGLRAYLLRFGAWAPVISAALMVLHCVVALFPGFLVTFANGLLFGWAWGALLSWSSAMLGAALCFGIARALGRPAVERLVGGSRALEVSDLFFRRYGNRAVLISRLLPFVSFDVISYGAGLTPVRFWSYFLATGIGQLPATLLYSYLGEKLTGSIRFLFWMFSITTVILILGWTVGPTVLRRIRRGVQTRPVVGEAEVRAP